MASVQSLSVTESPPSPLPLQLEFTTTGVVTAEGRPINTGIFQLSHQDAKGEADNVDLQFARLAELAGEVKADFTRAHGARAAAAAKLPDSADVGLHKFIAAVLLTDNASPALAMRREWQNRIAERIKRRVDPAVWAAWSKEEQARAVRTHGGNCWRHLVNTWIGGGEKAELAWLKTECESALESISEVERNRLRLQPGLGGVIRALAKFLGTGQGTYAKGEGNCAWAGYVESHYASTLVLPFGRAERGSRMDFATRCACPIYMNRLPSLRFLATAAFTNKEHILRDYLYSALLSRSNIAGLRARAIFDDKFTQPLLFWSASNDLDYSLLDLAPIADLTHAALVRGAEVSRANLVESEPTSPYQDPTFLMDATVDIYVSINEPAYARWRRRRDQRGASSKDGTPYYVNRELRRELYMPQDTINREVTPKTKAALQVWCSGALKTLVEGQGARYIRGGDLGVDNQTDEMKVDFEGT